jgi:regulator of ribonuclease activity A
MPYIATADLCDPHRDDPTAGTGALRVLPPVFRDYGAKRRFQGPVSTVRCFEDNSTLKAAVESPGWVDTAQGRVGRVLVVDGGGSLRRALLGGNLAASAVANGWAGVVIDGALRDVAELAVAALGIRALGSTPLPCAKSAPGQGAGARDLPVCVQGVSVHPGDWLVADEDGIVVLAAAPA